MSPFRFAQASLVLALGGAFVGCSLFGSEETASSTTSTSSGQAGAGGAAGAGGSGGTGGTAGASSSSGMGGSLPVDCKDYKENIDETSCNLLKQDCGNGETCRPNNLGTGTICLPGAGVKTIGAPCAGESDNECATGLYCVFGFCAPICCQSREADFCGSATCNVNTFPDPSGEKRLYACNFAKTCTLFADIGCPDNQFCRIANPDTGLALCAPVSPPVVDEGGPCTFLNNCGAAQVCDGNVCRYSCTLADWQTKDPGKGGCPMGRSCAPSSAVYGICRP